jgi:hypothetical protein
MRNSPLTWPSADAQIKQMGNTHRRDAELKPTMKLKLKPKM